MERLTTNKNVSDMGMVELALNCCYIAKDGSGRYRDYEIDMDERDFVRKLTTTLVGEDLPLQDESFDEEMMDNLGIDPFADVRGLIAIFYRNMWAMAELREKLKRYEDAEEQGLLIRLPCKVGDTVYVPTRNFVSELRIILISIERDNVFFYWILNTGIYPNLNGFTASDIGKMVFFTYEEAEAKLAEMEGAE